MHENTNEKILTEKRLKKMASSRIDSVEDYQIITLFCIAAVKVCINYAQIIDAVQINFSNSAKFIYFLDSAYIYTTQSKASR